MQASRKEFEKLISAHDIDSFLIRYFIFINIKQQKFYYVRLFLEQNDFLCFNKFKIRLLLLTQKIFFCVN